VIHHGDLFDVLPTIGIESIDACVTDPPYGIGFMGREWDTFAPARVKTAAQMKQRKDPEQIANIQNVYGRKRSPALSPSQVEYDRTLAGQRAFQEWTERWAREVLRVLKPGSYAVVCGAPRNAHRMACGLEDAGFEVRDCFAWLFGQGFPKSLDIQRAIDMSLCEEPGRHCMRMLPPEKNRQPGDHVCADTEIGQQWAGWGSGLKPSHEPIYVARKPFPGSLAENVLRYGVAALNIDACRVNPGDPVAVMRLTGGRKFEQAHTQPDRKNQQIGEHNLGRWPANVLLDEEAAELLDEQSGELVSGANPTRRGSPKLRDIYSAFPGQAECAAARGAESGGASRFFYVAKPAREERDFGCDGLPLEAADPYAAHRGRRMPEGSPRIDGKPAAEGRNIHPTVKPVALMRWLVRLVTPPDGVVLDPFTGSGTTGMACRYEHRRFIGIEREAEYVAIAERRIAAVAPLFSEAAS
jgi:DNA modification methylase